MSRMPEANLEYTLPSTIKSIQDGWQLTCTNGAILSGLMAVVSAVLLVALQASAQDSGPQITTYHISLTVLAYSALVLNISASLSSFILIDKLGDLPFQASQKPLSRLPRMGPIEGTQEQLLLRYGVDRLWTVVVYHWLVSFALGLVTLFAEIVLYIWKHEVRTVQIVTTCVVGFAAFPMLFSALVPCFWTDQRLVRSRNTSQGSRVQPMYGDYSLPIAPGNVSPLTPTAR